MAQPFDAQAGDDLNVSIRAAPSAYAALAGFWFVLGALYLFVGASSGRGGFWGALVSIAVGLAWVVWLHGFRLSVEGGCVVYRDGFYRSASVPLNEISAVRSTWVKWTLLGREIRLPRLVIDYGVDCHIVVNTKPFPRRDLRSVIALISNTAA